MKHMATQASAEASDNDTIVEESHPFRRSSRAGLPYRPSVYRLFGGSIVNIHERPQEAWTESRTGHWLSAWGGDRGVYCTADGVYFFASEDADVVR